MEPIDPRHFRTTLGHYPTGVVAVTAIGADGEPTGMAVGSFTSVSLDPPLVAFLPAKTSSTFPRIRDAGAFCVNVLSAEQEAVSRSFAARDGDRFSDLAWSPAPATGAPILDGAVAWIDCDIESVEEAGDHYVVIGRVRALDVGSGALPLIFFQGGYGRFSMRSLVAPSEAGLLEQLRVAELARSEIEAVASDLGYETIAVGAAGAELAFVASAGPPGSEVPIRVGLRIPFVPPLGAAFVAWGPERERDAWRARFSDAGAAGELDALLERVRERGWSLVLRPPRAVELENAVPVFSRGATPQATRELTSRIEGLVDLHEPAEVDPDVRYDVWTIGAPVFDRHAQPILLLSVLTTDEENIVLTGRDVLAVADRLRVAAARTTARIGGVLPPSHAAPAA